LTFAVEPAIVSLTP